MLLAVSSVYHYCALNPAVQAAAAAIAALGEPSDVLAAWLLDRITTDVTSPDVIAASIGIRNPEILRIMLRKVASPNFEERQRILEVVSRLTIEQVLTIDCRASAEVLRPACAGFPGLCCDDGNFRRTSVSALVPATACLLRELHAQESPMEAVRAFASDATASAKR